MKLSTTISSLALVGLLVNACQAEDSVPSTDSAVKAAAPSTEIQIAQSNNLFAFDFMREVLSQEASENVFFSPLSISTALAMVQAGARGSTLESMKQTLHLQDFDNEQINSGFSDLYQQLNAVPETEDGKPYELAIANGVWLDETFPVNESYHHITTDLFQAEFGLADFQYQPEAARLAINSWVEEKTNNLITDLFPEGSIDNLTRLVLANAIYFKGQWKSEFDPELTEAKPFWDMSGKNLIAENVEMMNKTDDFQYAHFAKDQVQVISLPYRGEDVSMVLVLPEVGMSLSQLQDTLDAASLQIWLSGLAKTKVQLSMPKFKISTEYDLKSYLEALGMGIAFSEAADFSGISSEEDLLISAAFHKAFIEVNEEGTEAAAATGIGVGTTSIGPEPVIFQADRPFVYFIVEKDSQTILFAGLMNKPNA